MPRPQKLRIIEVEPVNKRFYPEIASDDINTIDMVELEAMRLIDIEGLDQDSAAINMNISRGTLQRILTSARIKTTDALIHGKQIIIHGGNYQMINNTNCCRGERRFRGGRG